MPHRSLFAACIVWIFIAGLAMAEPSLKAIIIDGQNNHDWQATTPILEQHLRSSGVFSQVDVATSPPKGDDLGRFQPDFAAYDVLVSNYNGDEWPETTRAAFVDYVRGGGGVVIVHAANNAFPNWPEYNAMIGLGWRGADFADRLTLDDAGLPVRTPKGEGPGAGHGPQHAFPVIIRDARHPITRDLPQAWMHGKDELYHGQRGPARDMRVLATAFSSPQAKGTGAHEPMLWVIPIGEGRVFTTVLGHSTEAMQCVGFIVTFQRGAEWAATGAVTQSGVPDDFPTAANASRRD